MVRSKLNQCESWLFSCRRNRVYPARGEQAALRQFGTFYAPLSTSVDFAESVCAPLKTFPNNLTTADLPLVARDRHCNSYNFDRINDLFVVKNALTSYNLL